MSQHKMNIQDIIFLMMYIFIMVYLFIKILMTSCFVCATLNLGRKKSTGTEPKQAHPKDLNDAVRLAVELDAYNHAEKQSSVRATSHEATLDNFKTLLTDLSKKVDNLQKKQFVPQRMHETGPDTPTPKERNLVIFAGIA